MTTDLKQCALQARVVTCIKANGAEGRRLYARILGFELWVDKISQVARFLYFTIFVLRTNASCYSTSPITGLVTPARVAAGHEMG